jgi:GNAT superfamily N-acetyltransferase
MPTLIEFLDGPLDNDWTRGDHLHIYVRKSDWRVLGGSRIPALDVANARIVPEHRKDYRGHGRFTRWLAQAEAEADRRNVIVYLEQVGNRRLWDFYLRRGYIPEEGSDDMCAWRPVSPEQERLILDGFLQGRRWRTHPVTMKPEEWDAVRERIRRLGAETASAEPSTVAPRLVAA